MRIMIYLYNCACYNNENILPGVRQMSKNSKKSTKISTSENKTTNFFKNLDYFRQSASLEKGEFLRQAGVASINMWQRYANGAIPHDNTLTDFFNLINNLIFGNESLKKLLPYGISDRATLVEVDIKECLRGGRPVNPTFPVQTFKPESYADKFTGIYMVYYPTSKETVNSDHIMSYGVLCVADDKKTDRRLVCRGYLNISDYDRAKEEFRRLSSYDKAKLNTFFESSGNGHLAERMYEGELILGESFFWIYMSAITHAEFLAASFDMDIKTLHRDPDKMFAGTLGLALSQAAGAKDFHSIAFPMIISKHLLNENDDVSQVNYYLNLSHNVPDTRTVENVADDILATFTNLENVANGANLKRLYLKDILLATCYDTLRYTSSRSVAIDAMTTSQCYDALLKRKRNGDR